MPDIFPSTVLYVILDERYAKLIGSRDVVTGNIVPDTNMMRSLGSVIKQWLDGYFKQLTLGGVTRTTWPTAVAGSNGNVFMSGATVLNGQNGATITHNKGDTNYLVKAMPKDVGTFGLVGEISVVKAANTCVLYNSGIASISADIELSNIA
jgi:hypothetical protein